eukprot:Hpha_TRINITY_DN34175_c0_g1::TRINITY_DN34175_c0_g1_i1::g.75844::m.75844/K10769/ALKBH7; alkylated DNA repair protein alkB homolog 7
MSKSRRVVRRVRSVGLSDARTLQWTDPRCPPHHARVVGSSTLVSPGFVTPVEAGDLKSQVRKIMRGVPWREGTHCDGLLEGRYRERYVDIAAFTGSATVVLGRLKAVALRAAQGQTPGLRPEVQVLEMGGTARVRAHVDNDLDGSAVVVGLNLRTPRVMRLNLPGEAGAVHEMLLPPRAAYVLQGPARHIWQHAVLPGTKSRLARFGGCLARAAPTGRLLRTGRRLVLIMRGVPVAGARRLVRQQLVLTA